MCVCLHNGINTCVNVLEGINTCVNSLEGINTCVRVLEGPSNTCAHVWKELIHVCVCWKEHMCACP